MNRYILGALVITLALNLGLGWLVRKQAASSAALKEQVTSLTHAAKAAEQQRKFDAALLTRRSTQIAALRRAEAATQHSLEEALARNQAWAQQPVPKEVREALDER